MILRTVGVMTVVLAGIASAETRVSAKLVSDVSAVARGDSFRMGVLFTIPERSHIYWHNQGDSGLPTDVELPLRAGVRGEGIEWRTRGA